MQIQPNSFRFPRALSQWLTQALWGTGEPSSRQFEREQVTLKNLWPHLAENRGQRSSGDDRRGAGARNEPQHYSSSVDFVRAYAAYYLPANVLKVPAILAEAASFGVGPKGKNLKCLDIGSGPGTTAFGLAWWAEGRGGVDEIFSLDGSREFLQQGKALARNWQEAFPKSKVNFSWERVDIADTLATARKLIQERGINFVTFSNSIAEIAPDTEQRWRGIRSILQEMKEQTQKDNESRWLLIVEPGSRSSSRELLSLRDEIKSLAKSDAQVAIQLPCFDERPCGALEEPDDWCHEEISCEFPLWLNQLGRGAKLEKHSLIFSYLLVEVRPEARATKSENEGLVRMVSQRLERKGFDECRFCTKEGKVRARLTHSKNKLRVTPFSIPDRGFVWNSLERDEKDELLRFATWDNPRGNSDFSDLFLDDK